MRFILEWYIPNRVFETRGVETQSEMDLDQYRDDLLRILREAEENAPDRLIHNLHDMSAVDTYPPIYTMITRALPVLRFKNRGTVFFVTQSRKVLSVWSLVAHVMDFPYQVFETRKEAIAALEITLAKEDARTGSG